MFLIRYLSVLKCLIRFGYCSDLFLDNIYIWEFWPFHKDSCFLFHVNYLFWIGANCVNGITFQRTPILRFHLQNQSNGFMHEQFEKTQIILSAGSVSKSSQSSRFVFGRLQMYKMCDSVSFKLNRVVFMKHFFFLFVFCWLIGAVYESGRCLYVMWRCTWTPGNRIVPKHWDMQGKVGVVPSF